MFMFLIKTNLILKILHIILQIKNIKNFVFILSCLIKVTLNLGEYLATRFEHHKSYSITLRNKRGRFMVYQILRLWYKDQSTQENYHKHIIRSVKLRKVSKDRLQQCTGTQGITAQRCSSVRSSAFWYEIKC